MLIHTVYFWLIDGLSDADKAKFLEEVNKLSQIQSVEEFYCGKPAATPSREVVDESYDFGITVVLKDITAHDAYQEDPIHLSFIERCKHLWQKVKIYDAE